MHVWTYDAIGNRLTNTVNGVPQSYTYFKNGSNPLNGQRLSSDGINAYTYDANGNTLTRSGTPGNFTFGWDANDRMTSISGAATASYAYDYQGRRASKTEGGVTTTYLYDSLNPIAEIVSGVPRYVLNGPSIDEPLAVATSGTVSYLDADGLGSIIATNDSSGTVTHSLSFDAWGVPRNEIGTRAHGFTYTGREVGLAGLYFYRARFMQPGLGRFISEDPIGVLFGHRQLFPYVFNKPFAFRDAFGLQACPSPVPLPSPPYHPGPSGPFPCEVQCRIAWFFGGLCILVMEPEIGIPELLFEGGYEAAGHVVCKALCRGSEQPLGGPYPVTPTPIPTPPGPPSPGPGCLPPPSCHSPEPKHVGPPVPLAPTPYPGRGLPTPNLGSCSGSPSSV